MELEKKELRANVQKSVKLVQTTLDKDMNVPDSRPDVEKMVKNKGEIELSEVEIMNDRIRVRGMLHYQGLYVTAEAGPVLQSLHTGFELEEYINADGITPKDTVKVTAELDDLNVTVIHSRKLGIRALITFRAAISEINRIDGAVHAKEPQAEEKKMELVMTKLRFHKKDTCRVKGEFLLPSSKPNIRELLWEEADLRNPEIRLLDGKAQIRGEMKIFFLYQGEEERVPIQHIEWELPFHEEIPVPECRDGMTGNIHVRCTSFQLEVRPDQDGEERLLFAEAILTVDMKGYEQEQTELLQDIYRANYTVVPKVEPFFYESLIIQNNARAKIQKRIRPASAGGTFLQLIHVGGTVKIDEVETGQDGIYIEGVILCDLLFVTEEDHNPIQGTTEMIPFSYLIETGSLGEDDQYELEAVLDEISGTMSDGEEVEIRAAVSLNVIAFSIKQGNVITEVMETPYSYEKMKAIPGIAVHIADKEESLWDVAKEYGAGIKELKERNHLETDMLLPGQKIIIVKKVKELAF